MEIKNQNYTLKYGLRAMFAWEEMTGRSFEIKSMLDTYIFCYACIIANQENPSLDFNDFIDWCDEHPETINEFNDYINEEMKRRETISPKKKVTKKGRPKKNSQ